MKKKILLSIILIIFLLFPKGFFALEWKGGVDGEGGYVSACQDGNYCYSGVGLRISLYKLNGSSTTKVGRSHDYWKTMDYNNSGQYKESQNNPKTWSSTTMFSSLNNDDINDKKRNNLIPSSTRFNVNANTYKGYNNTLVTYYGSEWKWDYRTQNNQFISWINSTKTNSVFQTLDTYDELHVNLGLNEQQKNDVSSNRDSYYLVMETLFGIWVGSNSSLPSENFGRGKYYVGTLYELNAFTTKFGGMSIYATAIIQGTGVGNFATSSGNILKTIPTDATITQNFIKGNNAIGMGVYKLSDIISQQSCTDRCGSNPSLPCAENYCESNAKDNEEKRTCIEKKCKYNPTSLSCGSVSKTGVETNCSENEKYTIFTCKINGYIKTECTESTNVYYSNDLPVLFNKKISGFNYSVTTKGEKNCKLTFDKNKYEFDYASYKRSSTKRDELENYKNKAVYSTYEYKSDAKFTLNIDERTNKSTKFDLTIKEKSVNELKQVVLGDTVKNKDNSSDVVVNLYGNTPASMYLKDVEKEFVSTGKESIYQMPLKCYSSLTNTISNPYGDTCKDITATLTYGYYNTTEDQKVSTITKAEKIVDGNNYLKNNKCYYLNGNPDLDVNCYIDVVNKAGNTYTLKYYVSNRSGITVTSSFDGNSVIGETTINKTITVDTIIDASVSYTYNGETIIKKCPIKLSVSNGGENCKEKFNPAEYEAISSYCKEKWNTDVNGYTSYNDCYKRCSNEGRNGSCKTSIKCDDTEAIKNYCNTNALIQGYKTVESCINDCSCKGEIEDYFYRPISLKTPFPGISINDTRTPGINWLGFENFIIKEDEYGSQYKDETTLGSGKAEYIVELNSNIIKNIKEYNNIHSYLEYDGHYNSGIYKSNFINAENGFTCIGGECSE